ncbi:hypothetical protein [Hoyosella subflava]|uniref:hypothetical protein n=1 Tax=Hoyosella subflava TaxID=639313 RepID=UPI0011D1D543|nr:hypothetical protein [Hoyosella subflava]
MAKDERGREVIAEGARHRITFAFTKNRHEPAREAWQALGQGTWTDSGAHNLNVDEQIDSYAALLELFRYYAEHSEGNRPKSMNGLGDGLFEFKFRRVRFAFYDTPGNGAYKKKYCYRTPETSPYSHSYTWMIPDLDEEIRLTNGFPKLTRQTEERYKRDASTCRREDVKHDQSALLDG